MKGFTVLELMITLAIAAILAVTAIPTFNSYQQRQAMKAAVRILHGSLALARNEAVLKGSTVALCPGQRASGCEESNDWSNGWLIFADVNADKAWQSDEKLIRIEPGVSGVKTSFSPGRQVIRFASDGSAPGSNGSFVLCGFDGTENARKLVISNLGRIRRDKADSIGPELCPNH